MATKPPTGHNLARFGDPLLLELRVPVKLKMHAPAISKDGQQYMNADFLDAHRRHMIDGEALFQASRLANADQLFGFAVECGLKRLMVGFGMLVDATGSPTNRKDWLHADKVWDRYETYRSSSGGGANYVLPSPNPYLDWNASQRYANSSDVLLPNVEIHRTAAETVAALVKKAVLEGLI
ncbi:SAM-dependent methyltransferase [Pseudomonas putida]|uniref:SAM-dependent methyltransferase n=1 Tax=Pseudomonas putida TaxID=303 RepID=UPI002A0291F9|nr:SAM-dependent methyltransferase [Pseudomonas putida]